jgi:hypothetical protein
MLAAILPPEFISTFSLVAAIIGLLFLIMLPKDDEDRRLKALAIFIGGLAILVFSFLQRNRVFSGLLRNILLLL